MRLQPRHGLKEPEHRGMPRIATQFSLGNGLDGLAGDLRDLSLSEPGAHAQAADQGPELAGLKLAG